MDTKTSKEGIKITTIKLSEQTKSRIDSLRVYRRESYDDLIKRLLEILNLTRTNPQDARSRLMHMDLERKRPHSSTV